MKLSKISVRKEKSNLLYLFTYLYVHTCIYVCIRHAYVCLCMCKSVPMEEEVRQAGVSTLFLDTGSLVVLGLVS